MLLNFLKSNLGWIVLILLILFIIIRTSWRGFFWRDRNGNELSFKDFNKRWLKGVEGITPKQQTVTSLWGFPFIFGGIITGIVISLINKTWWIVLILVGSFPITLMQLVSTYQKYKSQKLAEDTMKKLEEQ